MRTMLSKILAAFLITAAFQPIKAQTTYQEMEQLTVNEQVTTVITASEPIRFVDISTDLVAGDQPINNTVRLKPKEAGHEDGEVLAIVTIVTERYRTQYALLYTTRLTEAVTSKEIELSERNAYHNPAVSMSTEDMYRYARQIWTSPARFRNVGSKKHRMTMRLNNIYSAGDYFFLDFSVENRTNIRFDIDEVRLKLSDKKSVESHELAGCGTEAGADTGTVPVVPPRLPQCDCGEETYFPKRQGADGGADGETDFRTHHILEHRL